MAGLALELQGKVALVSGGSRGIGAETVRLLRQAGARVAFSYKNAREQAEAVANECGGAPDCLGIQQKLSSVAEGRALVEQAVAALTRLDILVANHGIWDAEDVAISGMSDSRWRRTLAVNLDAVFGLVQGAVAQFERQRPATGETAGHIVLISSTAGQRGEAYHADYAVTKGAIISLTKSLSTELAPKGIRVNCVAPGWVSTDMTAETLAQAESGDRIKAEIPVGRVATPREIAGPVVFLCTGLAGFISGEVLNVNGGAVLVG